MKFIICIIALLPLLASAQNKYTRLEWNDCGSPQVNFYSLTLTPMPILTPGSATLTYSARHNRELSGKLKTSLNIIRSVNGLALPIRWLSLLIYFKLSSFNL